CESTLVKGIGRRLAGRKATNQPASAGGWIGSHRLAEGPLSPSQYGVAFTLNTAEAVRLLQAAGLRTTFTIARFAATCLHVFLTNCSLHSVHQFGILALGVETLTQGCALSRRHARK